MMAFQMLIFVLYNNDEQSNDICYVEIDAT